MSTTVFLAVILAALLHATWNAIVKGGTDKLTSVSLVVIGHIPFAIVVLPFVPLPSLEVMPFIFAGTALHVGYQLFLIRAYEISDLSHAYPIARGSAPLLVAVYSVVVLSVTFSTLEMLSIALIGLGIVSLAMVRHADGHRNSAGTMSALATGCFIAAYTLVDGLGARVAGNALSYYGPEAILNGLIMMAIMRQRLPDTWRSRFRGRHLRLCLLGGGASFVAYALVTWGFTQAPIALVAALREVSIVFALLIGVLVLKEPLNLAKVLSTFVTLTGAVCLRLSRQ